LPAHKKSLDFLLMVERRKSKEAANIPRKRGEYRKTPTPMEIRADLEARMQEIRDKEKESESISERECKRIRQLAVDAFVAGAEKNDNEMIVNAKDLLVNIVQLEQVRLVYDAANRGILKGHEEIAEALGYNTRQGVYFLLKTVGLKSKDFKKRKTLWELIQNSPALSALIKKLEAYCKK